MDWDKLRIFHAVATAGSLTHAGEALGLSQSAVSRQISALEDHLGTSLFHRHARGLSLTEAGDILFQATRDVDGRLNTARTLLTDSREKPKGPFRVTTTFGFGAMWLTPRLKTFTERYPDIELELVLNDRELDLGRREADVAIRLHPPTQPDLVTRRLFQVHYHLYASRRYVERKGMPASFQDLDSHEILLYAPPVPKPFVQINWLSTVGREGKPPRSAAFSVNSIIALAQAAESSMGIAALPDYLCADRSRLVRVMPEAEAPSFDTYFVYAESLRQSKRIAVFRDFMVEQARLWTY